MEPVLDRVPGHALFSQEGTSEKSVSQIRLWVDLNHSRAMNAADDESMRRYVRRLSRRAGFACSTTPTLVVLWLPVSYLSKNLKYLAELQAAMDPSSQTQRLGLQAIHSRTAQDLAQFCLDTGLQPDEEFVDLRVVDVISQGASMG